MKNGLLVNDVDNTIGDKDIWKDNLGAVDEYTPVVHSDHEFPTVHGCEHGAIHERGAVADGSINNYMESG